MTPAVHLFEEHAEVLAHWWSLLHAPNASGPVDVLYLDAHLDLQYVHPARIDRLRACASRAQVEALVKRHPLMPDEGTAYGIEDFLYPASQLGLIGRVIWVAPPHVDIDQPQRAMAWLQQMQGVTEADLASFRINEQGWLEGRLLGLHLLIGRLHQLASLNWPRPCVWDIDVDYCIGLPGDKVWITPDAVCQALYALPCRPVSITVSKSVGTGFTPARFEFLGEWFQVALGGEAKAAEKARAKWAARVADDDGTGRSDARGLQDARPGEPEAMTLLRQLTEIRARRLPCEMGRVLMWSRRVAGMADDVEPATQALLWAALGLLFSALRMMDRAMACAEHHRALTGVPHAGLAVDIGRQLMASGRCREAQPWLRCGLNEDETRVTAHVYLAQTHAELGDADQAALLLDQAIDMSPAWAALRQQRKQWP